MTIIVVVILFKGICWILHPSNNREDVVLNPGTLVSRPVTLVVDCVSGMAENRIDTILQGV